MAFFFSRQKRPGDGDGAGGLGGVWPGRELLPPLHPPPLPHSQTVLLKFADKRKTKMAAPAYF